MRIRRKRSEKNTKDGEGGEFFLIMKKKRKTYI
jgi:hypothetical protein